MKYEWREMAGGQACDWHGYYLTATSHGYTVQSPDGRVVSGAARGAYGRAAYNPTFLLSRNRAAAELHAFTMEGESNGG